MRITGKQLKHLSVTTLSGTKIGYIQDIIVDPEAQSIVQYQVKHSKFGGKEYLVSRDQVVTFEESCMVVYDTALPNEFRKNRRDDVSLSPEPAVMREE